MVKLQWLQVNKFRSVKPGTRLTFNAGHNVLLGQNGTGKTTLLNLIAAAVKSDFTDFKDEELDVSYALDSEQAEMTVSVRNENRSLVTSPGMTRISSSAFAAVSAQNSSISAFSADIINKSRGGRFKVDADGKLSSIQRVDEIGPRIPIEVFGHQLWVTIATGLDLLGSHDGKSEPIDWFFENSSLFNEYATRRFDESLAYFNDIGERQIKISQESGGPLSVFGYANPSDGIQDQILAKITQRWGLDRYVLADAELPFLGKVVQLLDLESAEAILELQDSSEDEQTRFMRLSELKFYFRRRSGGKMSEKMLSYGQKRMLAFSNYAASARSVIVADELVNGLHHQWIRACFEMMEGKQLFLTSQNPLLLDFLGFQSVEDVRSTFVLCRWDEDAEQMIWENMSQEAAQDFFDSYKVGFQQVGELLQTKGLW